MVPSGVTGESRDPGPFYLWWQLLPGWVRPLDQRRMADETRAPLDVNQVIPVMIEQLASMAWQKMGLQPDMMTGQIHRDIEQARLAIDACAALCQSIESRLDAEDQRSLQNLVRDLRVNFVERSAGANS